MADMHEAVADAVDSEVSTFTPRTGPTQFVVEVDADRYADAVAAALDAGFETFIDLCAIDYLGEEPRFAVVVNLLSIGPPERIRIKVGVPGDDPALPTITTMYPGASFYEREAWDMFGMVFDGHPDLARLLMPDEWEGHPLRKDEPVGAIPVEFKATR